MFEGIVGKNSLGNIAIDDIALSPGVCPSKQFLSKPLGKDLQNVFLSASEANALLYFSFRQQSFVVK